MAPTQATTISLRCKVPPGHIAGSADEYTLGDFPISSKIGDLRLQIQQQIPGNPAPAQQRILYGGRALVDNDISLAEALNVKRNPTQETYVVHLLVRGETSGAPLSSQRRHVGPDVVSNEPQQARTVQSSGDPLQGGLDVGQQRHAPVDATHHQSAPNAPLQQGPMRHPMLHPQMGPLRFPGFPSVPPPHYPGQPFTTPFNAPTAMQAQQYGNAQPGTLAQSSTNMQEEGQNASQRSSGASTMEGQGVLRQGENVRPEVRENMGNTSEQTSAGQPTGPQPAPSGSLPHVPLNRQGFHMEGVHPNGQRFTVHQQTISFPAGASPFGPSAAPQFFGGPRPLQPGGFPYHSPFLPNPSFVANARPREAVNQMQRILEELRNRPYADDEQRAQIERLQEQARQLHTFYEHSGHAAVPAASSVLSPSQAPPRAVSPSSGLRGWSGSQAQTQMPLYQGHQTQPSSQDNNIGDRQSRVTCYLLSSPNGPRAILYSPEHGTYTDARQQGQSNYAAFPPNQGIGADHVHGVGPAPLQEVAGLRPVGQDQPVQVPRQEPPADGPLQLILGHFWLLLRIMIFAYFLLGSDMGWRRPMILVVIGTGFWMVRMGLFGDGGVLRRWWEDIMQGPRAAENRRADGDREQEAPAGVDGQQARRMPTPEEVARRLLEQRARENPALPPQLQWLREQVRPAERAAALFIGSLWPGVGEAAVQAREAEERRRAEEEIAARRREDEERQRREAESSDGGAEGASSKEKPETDPGQSKADVAPESAHATADAAS